MSSSYRCTTGVLGPAGLGLVLGVYLLVVFLTSSRLLPSPPLSERRRYCDAFWRHAVCVCAALVSAAKVMRCIQCCVVSSVCVYPFFVLSVLSVVVSCVWKDMSDS